MLARGGTLHGHQGDGCHGRAPTESLPADSRLASACGAGSSTVCTGNFSAAGREPARGMVGQSGASTG